MRFRPLFTPLFALALPLAAPLAGCGGGSDTTAPTTPAPTTPATVETTTFASSLGIDLSAAGWTKTSTGLYYRTLTSPAATAATVAKGQNVTVRYTGWLSNGAQFTQPSPATIGPFVIGTGGVIAGWDEGIVGMRVGEKRRLLIPPALGYGAAGSANGAIPGNAVLVFDVEVLSAS